MDRLPLLRVLQWAPPEGVTQARDRVDDETVRTVLQVQMIAARTPSEVALTVLDARLPGMRSGRTDSSDRSNRTR